MKPDHPDMVSAAVADRRAGQADRQRVGGDDFGPEQQPARRISCRTVGRAARSRRASRSSRATSSTCAAAASSTRSCSGRWTPTARSMTRCCSATSRSESPAASGSLRCRSSIARDRAVASVQAEPVPQPDPRPRPRPCRGCRRRNRPRIPQRHDQEPRGRPQEALACRASARCRARRPRTRSSRTSRTRRRSCPRPIRRSSRRCASAPKAGMPKVLLVTSTRSGEGKSSSALALAQNFARRGKRVAADRRRLAQAGVQGGERQGRLEQAADDRRQGPRSCRRNSARQSVAAAERAGSAQPRRPAVDRPDPQDHRPKRATVSSWS